MIKNSFLIISVSVLLSACNGSDNDQNESQSISKNVIKQPIVIAKEQTCASTTDYMMKSLYGRALLRNVNRLLSKEFYDNYKSQYQIINGDYNRKKVNADKTCKLLDDLYKKIQGELANVDVSDDSKITKIECNTRSEYMKISQTTEEIIRSTTALLPFSDFESLMGEYKGIVEAYKSDPLHQNDVLQQSDLTHQNKACKLMLSLSTKADAQVLATRKLKK